MISVVVSISKDAPTRWRRFSMPPTSTLIYLKRCAPTSGKYSCMSYCRQTASISWRRSVSASGAHKRMYVAVSVLCPISFERAASGQSPASLQPLRNIFCRTETSSPALFAVQAHEIWPPTIRFHFFTGGTYSFSSRLLAISRGFYFNILELISPDNHRSS